MTIGSILAAVSLILCSYSPNALAFAGTLTIIEIAANLVQYGAAFALLVQLAPNVAQRSITCLTLIAGFASTIFWPITTTLQHWLTWQQTCLLFACLHLFLCVPVHLMLARSIATRGRKRSANGTVTTAFSGGLNTPDVTTTGYLGGLALAGPAGLWDSGLGSGLKLDQIVLVGQRDLDPYEQELIDRYGIPHVRRMANWFPNFAPR